MLLARLPSDTSVWRSLTSTYAVDVFCGVFLKSSDVVDRAVAVPIISGELILGGKLAAKVGGEGLTALIEPGMRAVSVQVNEISISLNRDLDVIREADVCQHKESRRALNGKYGD